MSRCSCGGEHDVLAHVDGDAARREAAVASLEQRDDARAWARHARLLDVARRLRAEGYAARAVYEVNALLARAA